jgi:hypothetical protein
MANQTQNPLILAEKFSLEKSCGYWKVNNQYFFNKFECLRYASSIKNYEITYHFHDFIYKSLDWSKEPIDSLQEMYKQRAQQIRDGHDYLILSFSGGADSTNVLDSFINNNIKLDEIYCEYPIEAIEKLKHKFNNIKDPKHIIFEWFMAAEPILKRLSITNPEIKITLQSDTQKCIEAIDNSELYKYMRPNTINPLTRYHTLYEIAREKTKYGKVAVITGLDKPRIAYNPMSKAFYSVFEDFSNGFINQGNLSSDEITTEHFYYTWRYPKLNQKMCFVIKNALLEAMKTPELYSSLLLKTRDGIHIYDMHKDFFKKILYETWDLNIWQAQKSGNIFYSPITQWVFDKDITTDKTREYYNKQLLELIEGIDDHLFNYENGQKIAPINFVTKANIF